MKMSEVTDEQIKEIISLHKSQTITQIDISIKVGVSYALVQKIILYGENVKQLIAKPISTAAIKGEREDGVQRNRKSKIAEHRLPKRAKTKLRR